MKKAFIVFSILLMGGLSLVAQQLDYAHEKDHRLKYNTLKELKTNAVASVATISITDVQPTSPLNPYVDIYYNVYAKLYFKNADPLAPAVLSEIELPCSLVVNGLEPLPSTASRTFTDNSISLTISPNKDYSLGAYHFNETEVDVNKRIRDISSAELSFNTTALSGISDDLLDEIQLELYVEFVRFEQAETEMGGFWTTSYSYLEDNEILIFMDRHQTPQNSNDPLPPHAYVELEWIHHPESDYYIDNGKEHYKIDFSGAHRIRTRKRSHTITNLFTDGYFLFRTRMIQPQLNEAGDELIDKWTYSDWSLPTQGELVLPDDYLDENMFIRVASSSVHAHIPPSTIRGDMNMEYKSTYAQEGKKAESVSLYDGSNRPRQLLNYQTNEIERSSPDGKYNDFDYSLQDLLYGYEGESTIDLLPSPLLSVSARKYQENVNLYSTQKITAADFDNVSTSSPISLNETAVGSAQYYSPSNPLYTASPAEDYAEWIPDAGGYPYSRKVLLDDGSGRIKQEFAPGETFATASNGEKNNQYFYVKPTQSELDYLFGTNVGEARFYKKNATVDGNGVVSLAYIDQLERTVATAITGEALPESKLEEITGNPIVFKEQLLNEGNIRFQEETKSFILEYPIFVPVGAEYKFSYVLDKEALQGCFDPGGYLCYTCDYDFVFQLIDQDRELIIDAKMAKTSAASNACSTAVYEFTPTDLHTATGYTASIGGTGGTTLSVNLQTQKSYTIIQKLQLNSELLDSKVASHLQDANCQRLTEEYFIQEELDKVDFSNCRSDFNDPCSYIRDSIKADFMYPFGALVENAPEEANILDYILVRTRREQGGCASSQVEGPIVGDPQNLTQEEKDEMAYRNGKINAFLSHFGLTEQPTFADFREEYADYFVSNEFHPSYCKLNACEALNTVQSMAFDRLLEESENRAQFLAEAVNWSHVTSNATLTFDVSNTALNLSNFTVDDIVTPDWETLCTTKYVNSYDVSIDDKVTFETDLALLPFDITLRNFCNTSLGFKSLGVFEPYQYPPSRKPYFYANTPTELFGSGSFKNEQDMFFLLFGYFGDYKRDQSNNMLGIADIAYTIVDDPLASAQAEKDWWSIYKSVYATAKRRFIKDMINLSSCVPQDANYATDGVLTTSKFWYTDNTVGGQVPNYPGYGDQWQWDKIYDWGEWWTNGSDCDIYIGEEIEDEEYADVDNDPNFLAKSTNTGSGSEIANNLIQDIKNQAKQDWATTCYNNFDWTNFEANFDMGSNGSPGFVEDPYTYMATYNTGNASNGSGCSVYAISLSHLVTPYLQFFEDASGNPYFDKSFPSDGIQLNCYDFDQAVAAFPSTLVTPTLSNGWEDVSGADIDQRIFKNWMNVYLGLNMSFSDYFEMAQYCVGYSFAQNPAPTQSQTVFGNYIDWTTMDSKLKALRLAAYQYGSQSTTQHWKTDPPLDLKATMTSQLSGSGESLAAGDMILFGETNYGNDQQDLFYLEDAATTYNNLLQNMNEVFNHLKPYLQTLDDFEDAFYALAEDLNIPVADEDVGNTGLKIDRAIRFSNGTIWARLLNSNGSFYDDYYFHYFPFSYDAEQGFNYVLSDIIANGTTDFTTITPLVSADPLHYVWLSKSGVKLLASTSSEITLAERIAKIQLDDVSGKGLIPMPEGCERLYQEASVINGEIRYLDYLKDEEETFKNNYVNFCTNQQTTPAFTQSLEMEYTSDERQFTLYYYDQAGNLVRTVPPKGIASSFEEFNPATQTTTGSLSFSESLQATIQAYREGTSAKTVVPEHSYETTYKYNVDNQIIKQTTPNGGTSLFWYDKAGRLALSQNEKQRPSRLFSYTLYDGQSRITETGTVELPASVVNQNGTTIDEIWSGVHTTVISKVYDDPVYGTQPYNIPQQIAALERNDVVRTYYDNTDGALQSPPGDFVQNNLRSRVATQAYYTTFTPSTPTADWNYATHYSYDVEGNVESLLNDYKQGGRISDENDRFKRLDYAYDPISGNVLQVYYQLGEDDAFYHRYTYDSKNRITTVETSRDGIIWDQDATYDYYLHGPLARTELGEHKVQGIDYAYTLQGWLKAVNAGRNSYDMGDDKGSATMAEDAFGYSLQYFNGDYEPIGGNTSGLLDHPTTLANLYNGNIAAQSTHNQETTLAKKYTYDQLNRIKAMDEHLESNGAWGAADVNGFSSAYDYDANGNLTALTRYEGPVNMSANPIDNMDYHYVAGTDKLDHVSDDADEEGMYRMGEFINQASGNYAYDAIGNLTKDLKAGIGSNGIEWYANGKIKQVKRLDPTKFQPNLYFEYDALGNRVKKVSSFVAEGRFFQKSTYYVRDAQGNIMATYSERDNRLEDVSAEGEEYYYQFSHDYAYYSTTAVQDPSVTQSDLLNFLNGTGFSRKTDLLDQAAANLENIPYFKSTLWAQLDVDDYTDLFPEAARRAVLNKPFFYTDYLFDNHLTDLVAIVNVKNEAWIKSLQVNNLETDFYDAFNGLYTSNPSMADVEHFFTLNRAVTAAAMEQSPTQAQAMLRLSAAQYTQLSTAYSNSSTGYSTLQSLLDNLATTLPTSGITDIRLANALVLVLPAQESSLSTLLSNISNLSPFYDGLSQLSTADAKELNSLLYHLNKLFEAAGLSAPFTGTLNAYLPMDVIDWDEDANGDYLDHFLHTDVAQTQIRNLSALYCASLSMSNPAIYYSGGVVHPYVIDTYENMSLDNHPIVEQVVDLSTHTSDSKEALFSTENEQNLVAYARAYFPYWVLEFNYEYDALAMAFNSLNIYSPFDYAAALNTALGLSFELLDESCNNCYSLSQESFDIYGSNRLGVMDAKESRKLDDKHFQRKLGAKTYELSDHLGNVVATVSDRKVHPQELLQKDPNHDVSTGFQPELSGRYDRFPFGKEIVQRSGEFSAVDYNDDGTRIVYRGLMSSPVNDWGSNGSSYTYNSEVQFGETILTDYYPSHSTDFRIFAKIKIDKYIPDLDPEATYRVEIKIGNSTNRTISSYSQGISGAKALVLTPSNLGASATEIAQAAEKIIIYEMTGQEWLDDIYNNERTRLLIDVGNLSGQAFAPEVSVEELSISQVYENTSIPLAQRNHAPYPYGFQGQETDNDWDGVAFGGGEDPLWTYTVNETVFFEETDFTDATRWSYLSTSGCYSLSGGQLVLDPVSNNCSALSETFFVEANTRYEVSFEADNTNNNTVTSILQYYDDATGNWANVNVTSTNIGSGINTYTAYVGGTTDKLKLRWVFTLPGTTTSSGPTYIDNLKVQSFLNGWANANNNAAIAGERIKFIGDQHLDYIYSPQQSLRDGKVGEQHKLSFKTEWQGNPDARIYVSIEQKDAVGNWGTIEQKEVTTIAQNTESLVEINFTPIQENIRLKIRATDPNNGGAALNVTAVEAFFRDFKITDGTTTPISQGGLANKVAFNYRVHDASVGRFLSVDPLAWKYPYNSPYVFQENKLGLGIELEGLELFVSNRVDQKSKSLANGGTTTIEEVYVGVVLAAVGVGAVSALIYGADVVGAWILGEISEAVLEEATGIPIIPIVPDPTDLADPFINKAAKEAFQKSIQKFTPIKTPYGDAVQSTTKKALDARSQVESGAKLYRIGTTGKSQASEAQFWALENPLADPKAFSKKYGIPVENIENANFIEVGTLKYNTEFITRPAPAAPGSPAGSGGGIEVVTPSNGVKLETFNTISN